MSTATLRRTTLELPRLHVVQRLSAALADHRWAFQGATAAVHTWVADHTLADLDVWVADESVDAMDDAITRLGGVLVCATTDPRRLRHRQYWLPTTQAEGTGAIIDVTVGDLRVGPTLLVPADAVTTRMGDLPCGAFAGVRAPVLAGIARVADLALRPLLRGRVVDGLRRCDAVNEFCTLTDAERNEVRAVLRTIVGRRHAVVVDHWLAGAADAEQMAAVVAVARRRLAGATLSPRSLAATWRQRALILPTRRKGPAGLRSQGVVVALVGTDGSGKSTTAERLGSELEHAGFRVRHEYFGMARGNLPGVGLIRKLAGGGDTTAAPGRSDGAAAPSRPSALHQAASWVYVLDYWWRAARRVRPALRRGEVVLCDRWVSDLRTHPAPGSPAARVAEWLVGAPHVFVLADAPIEEIVARKQERTPAEAAREQEGLRAVGAQLHGRSVRGGGRCAFHTVDTSAQSGVRASDRLLPTLRSVMSAAHTALPR
jgi:thymidylate kinase